MPSSSLNLHDDANNSTSGAVKLKQIAMSMFLDKNEVKDVELDRYHIELTYADMDGDTICIYSNDDIISALKEYSTIGKVKIMGKVDTRIERNDVLSSQNTSIKKSPIVKISDNRRFIHGRHTCKGCNMTPIFGKRFHCYSLKFDYCESCISTYDDDEVFVEDQLSECFIIL